MSTSWQRFLLKIALNSGLFNLTTTGSARTSMFGSIVLNLVPMRSRSSNIDVVCVANAWLGKFHLRKQISAEFRNHFSRTNKKKVQFFNKIKQLEYLIARVDCMQTLLKRQLLCRIIRSSISLVDIWFSSLVLLFQSNSFCVVQWRLGFEFWHSHHRF